MSKSNKISKINIGILLTFLLIILCLILVFINFEKDKPLEIQPPTKVIYDKSTNTLYLNSLTLKQKIAQMIITSGKEENKNALQNMLIGGIHLGAKSNAQEFIDKINYFQKDAYIPLFISTDLEGCWNPFENFHHFPSLKEIKTKEEAYQVGYEEGKLLKTLGFTINFAPVVDLKDEIWNCRSFIGTPEEISEKANAYINGLQLNGIIATSKHYPGKTLSIQDPHKYVVYVKIDSNDLFPFEESIKSNVSAIMVSHVITEGILNSESKPAVVSEQLTNELRNKFDGLIITDEIRMLGLRDYYTNEDQMYMDLFKADNDIILNTDPNIKNIYHMIKIIEKAVKDGIIDEKRIDSSVIRILSYKGINVKY